MDLGDYLETCLFMELLPKEIHFYIFSFLKAVDLKVLAQTSKDLKQVVEDDLLWKSAYINKWLKNADDVFVLKHFPRQFAWRNMYKTRISVEKKYLTAGDDMTVRRTRFELNLPMNDTEDWRTYLRKGKALAKHETEDLEEFLLLASVEQEEYKSAAVYASKEKDKKQLADIYYYWGRCIKDLSRNKVGAEKMQHLLSEEDKYKNAFTLEPTDSYILYSWAINLRFQLEFVEGQKALEIYKNSSKKYREALANGYIEKYVLWGLGSLKLHMAKKHIVSDHIVDATKYLEKAEKKYTKLQSLWEEGDSLTAFSLCFNYACIYVCRSKVTTTDAALAEQYKKMAAERLQDCTKTTEFVEYLTLDLLDLWYFDDFRSEDWFKTMYARSKPKKLNASW